MKAYVLVGETDKNQVPYIYDAMSGDEREPERDGGIIINGGSSGWAWRPLRGGNIRAEA